ncbi:Elongation factor Tu C-terminal domain containing protein [Tritrichomonas foetus]|uniref:Elongation factor Tu C-terminal domain containing protein n=1 Tax=Tritrichomonas foetus TaxID=1144522 RepID=A0A1J4JRM1_9EUKA|nr:Elongation factor Tu C-terminal domain containing protein [Tritrichomonas foetus]|eukprot:OHT00174.1 Elongation factor Tu C-terminal domain containing protein [Tritrichomonas foetus]
MNHSDDNNQEGVPEEEDFGNEPYPYDEEEDFYDDRNEINRCFAELDKKYDYSRCDREQMITGLRECDYNIKDFLEYALEGDFGPFHLKKKAKKPANQQPANTANRNQQNKNAQGNNQKNDAKPGGGSVARSMSLMPLTKPTKQHQDCKRTVQQVQQQLASSKKRINLVIVGHVDAGKSTLMGHLLQLTGNVSHGQMTKITKESNEQGRPEDCWAWVMAEDQVERERGVTIDVSMTEFQTNKLIVTVLDAPGHKDFVPNMIAGASQADAALLVVDVTNPLIDKGQAREHLLLCRSLGVQSLIVAVNKMDSVFFDQNEFDEVKGRLTTFLKSLGWSAINFIPTAANKGSNLKVPSKESPWYTGPTVLDAIDNLTPPQYDINSHFLLCISECIDMSSGRGVIATGRIECGYVCQTDNLNLLPADKFVKVNKIEVNRQFVPFATAGTIVSLHLTTQLGSENIPIGSALVAPERVLPVASQFVARVATFSMTVPLLKGSVLVFHRHAVDVPLRIASIRAIINKKTKQVDKKNPGFIPQNSLADVVFRLNQQIPLDIHTVSKSFGRFIIRAGGETLGFGSISDIISPDPAKDGAGNDKSGGKSSQKGANEIPSSPLAPQ